MDWSAQARHIFGIEPTAAGSWDEKLELIHPDDRPGLVAVLEAAQATGQRFACEYRVMRGDGAFRVIESHGEVIAEAGNVPSRILGTVQDITDRRQAEIERQNLASVLDTSDDAITTCSLDGVFVTWNRGAEKLYGYAAQEAIGQPLDLIIPPGERATDHLNWERLLNDEPVRSLETVRVTKDGRTVVVSVTRSLIVDATRGVIGVASVGRDITQAKQAQALLAAAHADAVAASQVKSQLLENMSHEIRTPMNGVIGMNELLLDTDLNDEQREYAEHIARSGEDMMVIINNMLDVSKIESGQLTLDVGDFGLHETLEQACADARAEASAKGLSFELQIAGAVPLRARGDGRRIRQVLLNLVANAVKFTAEGEIAVRADATPQPAGSTRLRVEIADTGIGIDPLALERMFEPFTQADGSLTRRYGGAGLGLAIARDLVELMGGEIGADSKPGYGSTFSFELDLGDCVF
jgi:PAS domain S-box-containing protein